MSIFLWWRREPSPQHPFPLSTFFILVPHTHSRDADIAMSNSQGSEGLVALASQEASQAGGRAREEIAISTREEAEANAAAYAALAAPALGEELRAAARYGEIHELEVILRCDAANVSLVDEGGNSALHMAAANGHVSCVSALVEAGAKHLPNASGNTPLHWACLNGHVETVTELLNKVPCKSSATAQALRTRARAARDAPGTGSGTGTSSLPSGGEQTSLAEEDGITLSLGEAAETLSTSNAAAISEPGIDVLQRNAGGKCAVDVCKTEALTNLVLKHESAAALELGLEKTSK